MKIEPYINRLNGSKEFKDFQKKNKDAYMAAGFFVLDLENGKNMHQLDYFIPKKKKIAAFNLDDKIVLRVLDGINAKTPEAIKLPSKIDLDALYGILEDEMKNRGVTDDIKKIIAIIQCIDGKMIWNINCALSGMGLLRAHIEDESKSVLKMEKLSILDFIKKIPGNLGKNQAAAAAAQQAGAGKVGAVGATPGQPAIQIQQDDADPQAKIDNLEKLKAEIEKQESELKKQAIEEEKASKPAKSVKKAKKK
ncbi:MAG: hypothetical protein WCK90_05020 [archaeon]